MRRDDLPDLAAFRAIAEAGSFTAAARQLGLSQSALSHTLRKLEDRLGVRLLTRTTRSLAPTAAGERLLHDLGPALDQIAAGVEALSGLRDGPAGVVRLTASQHAAETVLWPRLSPLLAEHPALKLELAVDSALVDIVAQRFDAGVRLGESLARDMIAVPIGPEMRLAVVAAPDYLRRHGIPLTPQDLSMHRCINTRFSGSGDVYQWEFERAGRALRVRVDGQVTVNSSRLALRAAADRQGIAISLEGDALPLIASGALVRLLDDWTPPFAGYHLYYPSRRQLSPAMRLIIERLRWRG